MVISDSLPVNVNGTDETVVVTDTWRSTSHQPFYANPSPRRAGKRICSMCGEETEKPIRVKIEDIERDWIILEIGLCPECFKEYRKRLIPLIAIKNL